MADETPVRTDLCETYKTGLENRIKSIEDANLQRLSNITDINKRLNKRNEWSLEKAEEEEPQIHLSCTAHSGFDERIEDSEDNVTELWTKYNSMQKTILGAAIALIFNLVVVITILIRTWPKGG